MGNNKHVKVTIIIVTIAIAAVTSLLAATMTIAPRQANALSIYNPDATNPNNSEGKIDQPLEQDDYTTTATTTPTVSCAMDTIKSLQSFLSCLGAK
jgi:hypothetical protein